MTDQIGATPASPRSSQNRPVAITTYATATPSAVSQRPGDEGRLRLTSHPSRQLRQRPPCEVPDFAEDARLADAHGEQPRIRHRVQHDHPLLVFEDQPLQRAAAELAAEPIR